MVDRTAATAVRQLERIRHLISQLDDTTIHDLVRRGRHTVRPDGWPTSTLGDGTPPSNSDYTGIEAAVDQRAFAGTDGVRHQQPDPTGDALRQLLDTITSIDKLAGTALVKLAYVRHVHQSAAGRVSSLAGKCACCERSVAGTEVDRLRGGYCSSCHRAWLRADRPDRASFEQHRRNELQAVTTPSTSDVTSTRYPAGNVEADRP